MYDVKLPKQINPLRFGQQQEKLCGYILTEVMSRLLAEVDSMETKVGVELSFNLDELSTPIARGAIQVNIALICQRCLKPFIFQIAGNVNWAFVRNDEQAKRLQQHYDPVLFEDEKINLYLQVEDELLLNLPMIAVHQNFSECCLIDKKNDAMDNIAKTNPFDKLKNIKIKK